MYEVKSITREEVAQTVGIVVLFAFFTVGFFWRILFSDGVYFPIGGDFVSLNFPQDVFGITSLQRGEIPLWNPYLSAGRPFAADPNVGFFYPLKLLFAFGTGFNYLDLERLVILHYFLSGLTMYMLCRDLSGSRWGSIVAGLAYMFSGVQIGHMEHPNLVMATPWLPLVFMFVRRAIITGQVSNALYAGGSLAISIFAHAQFSLLMAMWVLIWLIGYWLYVSRRNFWRDSGLLIVAITVALAASAVLVLPALELVGMSTRGQLSRADATSLYLPPQGWLMLALPHFWGSNAVQSQSLWSGYGNLNEAYGYVGMVTLFLSVIGIAIRKHRAESAIRSYETLFLTAMAVMALLLAAGELTPIYQLLYTSLPVLHLIRVPARFLYWFDLSLPLLAAFGMDFFLVSPAGKGSGLWRVLFIGTAVLTAMAVLVRLGLTNYSISIEPQQLLKTRTEDLGVLIGLLVGLLAVLMFHRLQRDSANLLPVLVIALLAIDLLKAQGSFVFTTHDPLEWFRHPEVINEWKREARNSRIDSVPEAWSNWEPLTGLINRIPMASGLPWEPFELTAFKEYSEAVNHDSRGYDFLNVGHLVEPRGTVVSDKWLMRPVGDPVLEVYENSRAMPRAFMVFHSIIEPDSERTLEMIRSSQFNPRQTVLLESGIPITNRNGDANAQIVSSMDNSVVVEVSTPQDGYLVMSDTYYPGWHALVDQSEAQLVRANYAFRAVFLRAGAHAVRFEFDPLSWRVGLTVSLLAWGVLGLMLLVGLVRPMASVTRTNLSRTQ